MKLTYHANLDGMRGIAAMMVVLFHFFSYPDGYYSEPSLLKSLTEIGQHGVSLFFVLSGFVITRILIHAERNNQYFSTFFIRRILRIAPLYYFFLLFWFFVLPFLIHYPIASVTEQLPYYFYLQNIYSTWRIHLPGPPHFWSLAVEEHFYLIWPFVVYYTAVHRLNIVIIFGIIITFVVRFLFIQNEIPIHDFTFARIDQILLGAGLAVLESKGIFKMQSLKLFGWATICFLVIASAVYMISGYISFFKELFKYFLLGLSFALLLSTVLSLGPRSFINRFLTSDPMQYLGRISYGIYVWHVLALVFLQFFLLTGIMILDIITSIALTLLFAHCSYYYLELPFIRLKDSVNHLSPRKWISFHFLFGWVVNLWRRG